MADLVDRRVAIDALRKYIVDNDMYDMDENVQGFNEGIDLAISELSVIPSAQPEAKTPTWKEEDRFVKGYFTWYPYCPKCDHEVVTGQCYCEICGQHIDWSEEDG